MAAPQKTGIYHSELAKLGTITVDVISDVLESKFKKGTYYIKMVIDGRERDYFIENEAIATELEGLKDNQVTIEAIGTREEAQIVIHSIDEATQPTRSSARPAPSRHAARPSSPQARPAPARPAAAQAPARPAQLPAQTRPATEKVGTKAQLVKLGNLVMHCECAAKKVAEILMLEHGIDTSEEAHKSRVAMLFIQMTRDNYHHQQRSDAFLSVNPPAATPAPTEAAPEGEESPAA